MSFRRLTYIFATIAFLLPSFAVAGEVVVLHSTDAPTAWTRNLGQGLQEELAGTAKIVQAHLGSRDRDDDHFEDRYESLADAWADRKPLAVVADGRAAFGFMRKYRDDLFAAAPVVYCAMERPEPEHLRQCGNCVTLPISPGVRETVDYIFRLRPETTVVAGIMDGSHLTLRMRQEAEDAMEAYLERAQMLFPGHEPGDDRGLDMRSLESVAASMPKTGAVLFLGYETDNRGEPVHEGETVRLLARKSEAPVFALSDQWSGSGILGGVVIDSREQGREAGRIIKRLLSGESAREMLVEPLAPHPLADLSVMARIGIPASRLPVDATTINAPVVPETDEAIEPAGIAWIVAALIAALLAVILFRRSRNP